MADTLSDLACGRVTSSTCGRENERTHFSRHIAAPAPVSRSIPSHSAFWRKKFSCGAAAARASGVTGASRLTLRASGAAGSEISLARAISSVELGGASVAAVAAGDGAGWVGCFASTFARTDSVFGAGCVCWAGKARSSAVATGRLSAALSSGETVGFTFSTA